VIEQRKRLRELIERPGARLLPGVASAFHARQAESAGFELLFTTGSGISNTWLGAPDLGLATMSEIIDVTRSVVDATSLPVIADADTGYGNHLNVIRTAGEMEWAGVAGFVLEVR
jgi:2-methylisocitrate lyase-like PEP mutase family enzyme